MGYVTLRIRQNFEDICMLCFASSRGEKIRTSDLYVPNVALYQAELRPDKWIQRKGYSMLLNDNIVSELTHQHAMINAWIVKDGMA